MQEGSSLKNWQGPDQVPSSMYWNRPTPDNSSGFNWGEKDMVWNKCPDGIGRKVSVVR